MKVHEHIFDRIALPENLFAAWEEFRKGKGSREDVQIFERNLETHIFALHRDLAAQTYRHGPYGAFTIQDPKQRRIHKAAVRDRILHHAVFAALNPVFEPAFIAHSFSCRKGKGTHRGVDALERMLRQESRNRTRPCFVLKCDVHRFFASVDHAILLTILGKRIKDDRVMTLLGELVGRFGDGKGIPIGNLTSQLFANVYMNELDQCMKHELHLKRYIRYTDDVVVLSNDRDSLQNLLPSIRSFLRGHLRLELHPRKVTIRKHRQGVDFLGYVLLPHHRVLRTKTKRRMVRKLQERVRVLGDAEDRADTIEHSLQSYLGVFSHANALKNGR
ncbi:RNA-dependent DNA polymerase [Candidatus Peregrinibacteria bacterium]|nr:RNA-dependent DNA polymerase [Candidatus Peregrinibacteria bacterium]